MDFLKQLGINELLIGNALLSLIGLIFTLGIPKNEKNKKEIQFWAMFWISLLMIYTINFIWLINNEWPFGIRLFFQYLSDIIGSLGLSLLFFCVYSKKKYVEKKVIIILIPTLIVGYILETLFKTYIFSNIFTSILLFLIAWRVRLKDITSTVTLFAYANLQLIIVYIIIIGKAEELLLVNYRIAIGMKLTLLVAIYKILDVNKKEKQKAVEA